jgi:putative hemolysin
MGLTANSAQWISVAFVVVPLTLLNVVLGELVPKTLALKHPARIAMAGARTLIFAERCLAPAANVLEWITKALIKTIFRNAKTEKPAVPAAIEIDNFSPLHQSFFFNLVEIENTRVRDILVPWSDVVFANDSDSLETVYQKTVVSGHTRLPVLDGTQVIGILHSKEFMALKESGETRWLTIVRPILRVQLQDPVLRVLRMMQEKRSHMVLVLDAKMEKAGIITVENILEEIVGDIYDEDDDGRARKILATSNRIKARIGLQI